MTTRPACSAVSHAFSNNNRLHSEVTSLVPTINHFFSIQPRSNIQVNNVHIIVCLFAMRVRMNSEKVALFFFVVIFRDWEISKVSNIKNNNKVSGFITVSSAKNV